MASERRSAGERILVVDDEPGVRTALEHILRDEGYHVTAVGTAEEGLAAVEQASHDAILLDVWLPGMDGLEALRELGERRVGAVVVMISGHGNIETAVRATKLGAFDFVEKPLSLEKTLLVLRNALRQRTLERRNRQLLRQLAQQAEIVGKSVGARRLREAVDIAAATEAPVLLCGERGSGREMLARRIHAAGPRADGPFVEVPCGAPGAHGVEAVLGSGDTDRVELAAGGSLFLADPDRLPAEQQQQLAAALPARLREGPGMRLMASTDPGAGRLLEALRQCLDVVRIDVPALRERREDVPLLAKRSIERFAREYGRPGKRLSDECLTALRSYAWPGNVAELHNMMERLLLFVDGEVVRLSDLPESMGGARPAATDLYREFASLTEGLEAFERYYVQRVVVEAKGDVATAAARLGLSEDELARRLESDPSS